jgi:hypothetical protein
MIIPFLASKFNNDLFKRMLLKIIGRDINDVMLKINEDQIEEFRGIYPKKLEFTTN